LSHPALGASVPVLVPVIYLFSRCLTAEPLFIS
jgi:hypothetical protein